MELIEQTKQDEKFMRMALVEAHKAMERDEVPIGAVIVAGNRVIARGHNLTETLTDLGGKYLTECTLYVTVEPCLMCAGALGWSQIKRIVYGASDDKRGYHTFCEKPFHKKTEIIGGFLAEECAELMTTFFKQKR